jgi:hypothetical protein
MYIKFRIIFPNKIEKKIITKLEKILISSSSNKNIENSDALLVEMDNISSSEVKQILEGSNYANDEEEDVYDQEGCPIQ